MKPTESATHPDGWSTATVSSSVEVHRGLSWSKEQEHLTKRDDTVPVLGIGNVQDRLIVDDIIHIAGVKPAAIDKKKVTSGWTLMVGSNGNRDRIGNAVFIKADTDYLFGSFLLGLHPKSGSGVTSSFLYRWLMTEQVQAHLSATAEGTTGLSNLSHSFFRAMEIPFPSDISEQIAITSALDAVDESCDRTLDARELAVAIDHTLLNELVEFGLDSNSRESRKRPDGWSVRRVDEIADVGSGLTLGRDVSGFRCQEVPYLRVANVQDGHLDLRHVKAVRVPEDEVDSFRLRTGDVLMTEGGDLDKLGRGTMWTGDIDPCLHQNHIFRVRLRPDVMDPQYFAYVVESDIAKAYFNRVAKRTTNLASINKTQLRAFRLPVPPMDDQGEIVRTIAASKARIRALDEKLLWTKRLKQSLTHDLLNGQVRLAVVAPEAVTV